MKIHMNIELDTNDRLDRLVLDAINGALNRKTATLIEAPATDASITAAEPVNAARSDKVKLLIPEKRTKPETAKPENTHTDTLMPPVASPIVQAATPTTTTPPVVVIEPTPTPAPEPATATPTVTVLEGPQPTKEDLMAIFSRFVKNPKVGGPKALAGVIARFGDEAVPVPTALSGPTAIPVAQYGALKAELERLLEAAA